MSLVDLLILYFVAGAFFAVATFRREDKARRMMSAGLAIILWPLWAPVVLAANGGAKTPPRPRQSETPAAQRIRAALREGVAACDGTPLTQLLRPDAEESIVSEIDRTEARRAELAGLLARAEFDLAGAEAKLRALQDEGASARALGTARLHVENVKRLHGLHARDGRALEELADLVEALRTQLVLARYQGSSVEGVGGIVAEMWERVEALGEALDEGAWNLRPSPIVAEDHPREAVGEERSGGEP